MGGHGRVRGGKAIGDGGKGVCARACMAGSLSLIGRRVSSYLSLSLSQEEDRDGGGCPDEADRRKRGLQQTNRRSRQQTWIEHINSRVFVLVEQGTEV